MRALAVVSAVVVGAAPLAARQSADSPAPLSADRTGAFQAVLTERSPESQPERWGQRFGFPGDLTAWDYDLGAERFSVYVPDAYAAAGAPYGVVVWVSPTGDGSLPSGLRGVLDERRLIWIGADGAGNDRHLYQRAALALDAVANIGRVYDVDPARVFVAGFSGGGRVAAMYAVAYPDVFAGGFAIAGVTTYLEVALPGLGSVVTRFPEPSPEVLALARRHPLVILTGSGDFNREECRRVAESYERAGHASVHLLDIAGLGHALPSSADFARGLALLEDRSRRSGVRDPSAEDDEAPLVGGRRSRAPVVPRSAYRWWSSISWKAGSSHTRSHVTRDSSVDRGGRRSVTVGRVR